ncbi:Nucleolar protein 4-like protein [Willisornis vidua]|uniref:Nucleolar protein 4-like protein n=1 Tax=Willisornis vidua TaxID=1566151 RepID=A0ABQ9DRG5_9PASS|nr:Nucleolar protein 4-like protein [Willisornis vidua]
MAETNSNGKTNLEQDEQPLNLSDSPLSAQLTSEYRLDDHSSNGKNKYKTLLISDLKMEREARENGSKIACELLTDPAVYPHFHSPLVPHIEKEAFVHGGDAGLCSNLVLVAGHLFGQERKLSSASAISEVRYVIDQKRRSDSILSSYLFWHMTVVTEQLRLKEGLNLSQIMETGYQAAAVGLLVAIGQSPAHSYSSYDSGKNESVGRGAEDLSLNRGEEDEDDHDEQEDPEKVNESDGVEAERLKAFNMFVRLFVDENLDRMVPISKQPKEKIQAIIDSCRRQFPEYQERARKRIRTYLKSCRRMKRSGFEMSRPIPSHLTSAVAESILASACESESRNAAKRMRLDRQQDETAPADKQYKQEPAQVTYSTSAVSSTQEVLYINGNGTYSYHSYRGLGGGLLNLNDASSSDLQPTSTTAATQHCIPGTTNVQSPSSSGPTDLSMKRQLATSSGSSSSSSSRPQLSPTEINAVRQLVAGYRESAAFLLRSADELENLILQQN